MKNKKLAFILPVAVMAVLLFSMSFGLAGGGVNHKVRVKNDTSYTAVVTLTMFNGSTKRHEIDPNTRHKFETGAKCPNYLSGELRQGGVAFSAIKAKCTNSGGPDTPPCDLDCSSSQWRIHYYSGSGYAVFERD